MSVLTSRSIDKSKTGSRDRHNYEVQKKNGKADHVTENLKILVKSQLIEKSSMLSA